MKTSVVLTTKNWLQMALRPDQKTWARTVWSIVLRKTLS
ncbi:hypothetical protein F444_05191 [Phytophthora nicotianae P1976]|uniref:Uncharacterized protein n=1 Tax=Phytophthora nicotianae P1976 TaxID=1317066 RepID=A0A081AMY0_PHYNI|nr:hypothetical protein F444_05191 [Phytophthora nicotianae P1976]